MIKKIAGKNNRRGASLAETLVVIMIMLMVAGVMVAGIPAAADVLAKTSDASHSQVLLSTSMTALRDELSMAKDVKRDEHDEQKITYTDAFGAKCVLTVSDGEGIHLEKVALPDGTAGTERTTYEGLLVSKEASTEGLYSTFTKAVLEDGIVKFEGLRVCKKKNGDGEQVTADLGDVAFEVRVIGNIG